MRHSCQIPGDFYMKALFVIEQEAKDESNYAITMALS